MIAGQIKDFTSAFSGEQEITTAVRQQQFRGVVIDSREVTKGNIFICIVGEINDGHDFVKQAIENGASVIIKDDQHELDLDTTSSIKVISVKDTLDTLGQLAKCYLDKIAPRKIAITGTNGKTTCKDLITEILINQYKTCATEGNYNNLYGVPLSIFKFEQDCQVAVFEFGMSTSGEIRRLVEIVQPEVRVILNIGPAHLQTMKTIENIAAAKFEILYNARENDWAVINIDDQQIKKNYQNYTINKVTFGTTDQADLYPEKVYNNGSNHTHFVYENCDIRIPLLGTHHLHNCLAAIAVAQIFSLDLDIIKQGIESYETIGNRMAVNNIAGITIINDSYNANPVSVKAVLDTIKDYPVTGSRVLVIGDMLELGEQAEYYHKQVGEWLAEGNLDKIYLIGEYAETIARTVTENGYPAKQIEIFQTTQEIVDNLLTVLKTGDLLLLKASRALQLEDIEIALRSIMGRNN